MALGENVPARVDELEEELPGVRGFGTLLVVSGGRSLSTSFRFALPPTVLVRGKAGQLIYHLFIQKEPGTLANPLTVRIHLPNRATLNSISREATVQGDNLLIDSDLRTDFELELVFTP